MSNPMITLINKKAQQIATNTSLSQILASYTKAIKLFTTPYAAANNDIGKLLDVASSNVFLNALTHNPGDQFSVYNNSSSSALTVTQNTGVTLYMANTSNSIGAPLTGNRTISPRGHAHLTAVGANTYIISTGVGIF